MTKKSDLNAPLLKQFISTFYGYGNYRGQHWFIGMEEGGGNTPEEIQQRLAVWEQRGKHELEDIAEYHLGLGYDKYFTQPTTAQSTWNKLIRMVLSTRSLDITLSQVKQYQREALGRWQNETCLLELLPLPSPSARDWLYATSTSVPGLESRKSYRDKYAPPRAEYLRQRIHQYQPSSVVFYGFTGWYLEWWRSIAGVNFEHQTIEGKSFCSGANAHTQFLIVHHPTSHGITNNYFHHLGRWLA